MLYYSIYERKKEWKNKWNLNKERNALEFRISASTFSSEGVGSRGGIGFDRSDWCVLFVVSSTTRRAQKRTVYFMSRPGITNDKSTAGSGRMIRATININNRSTRKNLAEELRKKENSRTKQSNKQSTDGECFALLPPLQQRWWDLLRLQQSNTHDWCYTDWWRVAAT